MHNFRKFPDSRHIENDSDNNRLINIYLTGPLLYYLMDNKLLMLAGEFNDSEGIVEDISQTHYINFQSY